MICHDNLDWTKARHISMKRSLVIVVPFSMHQPLPWFPLAHCIVSLGTPTFVLCPGRRCRRRPRQVVDLCWRRVSCRKRRLTMLPIGDLVVEALHFQETKQIMMAVAIVA